MPAMTIADHINLVVAIIGGCSLLVSLFVAVITLKIVRANRETVEVMRVQFESSTRPYVDVAPIVADKHPLLLLRIRNSGTSAARNLKLDLDKDFYFNAEESEGSNLRRYTAFVHPIGALAPRSEITFILGVGHTVFRNSDRCPMKFNVTATYEFEDKRVTEVNAVDLQPFMKVSAPRDPFLEQIEKINDNLKFIGASLNKADA